MNMPSDIRWSDPEFRVIGFARKYVITHEKWEGAEFERPERKPDGGWSVLIRKVPNTPESTLCISLDDAGHVTEVRSEL